VPRLSVVGRTHSHYAFCVCSGVSWIIDRAPFSKEPGRSAVRFVTVRLCLDVAGGSAATRRVAGNARLKQEYSRGRAMAPWRECGRKPSFDGVRRRGRRLQRCDSSQAAAAHVTRPKESTWAALWQAAHPKACCKAQGAPNRYFIFLLRTMLLTANPARSDRKATTRQFPGSPHKPRCNPRRRPC
jgi:hypothetical protein